MRAPCCHRWRWRRVRRGHVVETSRFNEGTTLICWRTGRQRDGQRRFSCWSPVGTGGKVCACGSESPGRVEHCVSHGDAFDVQLHSCACSTWAMTARVRASARWAVSRVSKSHRDRAWVVGQRIDVRQSGEAQTETIDEVDRFKTQRKLSTVRERTIPAR